ncbi:Transcriptional regulator, MarR family (plasmid) [Ketogulonicigenium vulgare Y25]|uniref:Transcriptional regulator, MarR family protein n=1 Tax=Ketogulonicigenium vulgare (strain WSH-001) TaxID=759362 RepID=F9YBU1_KETVW|nr:MarR family winged helix-turn-helix transcriptional regulator [Ketogulonicigenium vulgare]ADO44409.1 Transcriptional regulator, MarR family [Ketogulonicigenium vulgare Y25]AEM42843.1 Transcriptional regulator, MarR family protein [Ketogulonicigenium vulgare WSH-001]ALJ82729.1 MarR family transcriptional regulator [Ketogulonicigenium vulgare]
MPSDPEILDQLLRLMRSLRRNFDIAAAELGLTSARARVISALSHMEGATQAELAQKLEIEAPTLKRQVDALEDLGFIERRGVDGDARKRALFLTDLARSSSITRLVREMRRGVLTGIPPEDRDTLSRALDIMAQNAARISEDGIK